MHCRFPRRFLLLVPFLALAAVALTGCEKRIHEATAPLEAVAE